MFFHDTEAQVLIPGCATDQLLKAARNDPGYKDREQKMNSLIRESVLQKNQARLIKGGLDLRHKPSAPQPMVYTLPIVFHIVSSTADSISDAQVYATLAELNDAFAHRNAYGNDTNGVDTYIQFCMARTTPDGGLTNGIDRVNTYYENHDVDLEGGVPQSLISWDPSRYVNVWVVSSIQSELQPSSFKCGGWKRMGIAGYASVGGGWGAIVSGLGVPLLAHELGHYLSLLHTFTGMDCANSDCSLDGDLVCDTPPDKSTESSPCSDPENSCNTDTISGPFTKDVRDNISNFMDYGSPCPTVFTQGQADRMRSFVELYNGGILINSILCNQPCGDTIDARFNWNTNPHPIIGDTVTFTNNSKGALKYKWYVDDVLVDSIDELRYGFSAAGTYKVTLIAYAEDSLCFASYTGNVIVNCGVVARFSPTERIIASKKDMYSDPVRFWNKSWGATEFEWYVQDPVTGIDSMVSTDVDLVYDFPEPGAYRIRLVARNGSCESNSPVYTMVVEDPSPDGLLNIKRVDCYKNDSLRIVFSVINTGFDTIPANLSVTFYDRPSHLPGAQKMTSVFYTDRFVIGRCEVEFVHIVKTITNRQDYVFGIIDEEKAVYEKSDLNNTSERSNFQIRLSLNPPLQLVYVHTDTSVRLRYAPDAPAKITWTTNAAIIYDSIQKVGLRITDTTLVRVNTESIYACTDSAFADIHVYPIDIRIKTQEIYCYKNDSLLLVEQVCLGNRYKNLKRDIQTLYYDNVPNSSGAVLLGRSLLEKETIFTDSCVILTRLIKMTGSGKVYSKVNVPMTQYEDSLSNNTSDINYIPFRIRFPRPKIEIYRNEPYRLSILNDGERYKSLLWTPSSRLSCSTCPDPLITTTNNERLKVTGTTQYDCTDSAFLDIKTFSRSHVSLPNVFTPNADGLNDYFYVIASEKVARVRHFQVFNRWGEKMFEAANTSANDNKSGWDGTFKGNKVPMGSYVYVIVVELTTGELETYKGTISILR